MFDCFMGAHGTELCVTDGTVNGTSLITDMTPGVSSSVLVEAVPLNGEWLVLSSGQDASMTHGVSLWSTDGTEMSLQYNPWPGSSNSSLGGTYGPLLLTDTQAFFIAHDGVSGHEWHRFSHGEISDDWMVLNVQ
jgi:ELWxxDGT repeat protein